MRHTYLFYESEWVASGVYYNNAGTSVPFEGGSKITHQDLLWRLDSRITLCRPNTIEFTNTYEITPLVDGQTETQFVSRNPSLGRFTGSLIFVEDTIFVCAHSEDHSQMVIETNRKIDNNTYANHGVLLVGNVRMSSWTARLSTEAQKLKLIK
ncbi:MAG: hypothetical protein ACD_62C00572G0005 [uncultured bacterium]|nr:MAG: hypothetical protein ACD_62C00572G0005 [uncultured bacterium]HLD45511.1 hypothetical protein [bacterium]